VIEIHNIFDIHKRPIQHRIPSTHPMRIDGNGWTLLPAGIDPHVHVRTPGLQHKEDWKSAAKASIAGGYSTLFDMPNTIPSTISETRLKAKKELIDQQLAESGISLRYHLYLGAEKNHFDHIAKVKKHIIGIKVCMGSTTGDLLMDDESSLHALFCLASRHDLIVAVHAEDERMIKKRTLLFKGETSPHIHSIIRNANVAAKAVAKAISLSKLYRTKLYIAHVSTKAELDLIRKAKDKGLSVYAEATPHHLFLSDNAYGLLGTRALMNPPLRSEEDRQALWQAIHDGTIDTIGSDHAPHTLEEKMQPFGKAHAGVPGIETTLPLLFTAYAHQ
jgi:dihydroorotase